MCWTEDEDCVGPGLTMDPPLLLLLLLMMVMKVSGAAVRPQVGELLTGVCAHVCVCKHVCVRALKQSVPVLQPHVPSQVFYSEILSLLTLTLSEIKP